MLRVRQLVDGPLTDGRRGFKSRHAAILPRNKGSLLHRFQPGGHRPDGGNGRCSATVEQ